MASFSQTGVNWPSITQNGKFEPFELQVARKQITNHSVVSIYGYQPSVGTSFIPTWENATTFPYPSSAVVMTIASASGATDAGVQVTINGLDANYNTLSETVTLNASGTVNTVNSYFRINGMTVIAGAPAGIITAKNGGTTYAQINVGINRTQMSIYTVPAGYTFYLNRAQGFTSTLYTASQFTTYRTQTTIGGVTSVFAQRPFVSNFIVDRLYPNAYAATTDIQWQVAMNSTTAAVGLAFEGVLIANDMATTF
jgi:hypothetical protein